MQEAVNNIGGLWGIGTDRIITEESIYYLKNYFVVLIVAIVGATGGVRDIVRALECRTIGKKIITVTEPLVIGTLILIITAYLVDGSFNPFLYFRF